MEDGDVLWDLLDLILAAKSAKGFSVEYRLSLHGKLGTDTGGIRPRSAGKYFYIYAGKRGRRRGGRK